jgi:DNA-binding beta-propeller fold protein YncE
MIFATVLLQILLQSTGASGFNLAVVRWGNPNTELFKLDTDGNKLIGLAGLGKRLYAVCVMTDSIYVFRDTSPYSRVDILKVPRLSGMGPGDIVADHEVGRLYIIDWRPASEGGTRIWSVDPILRTAHYLINGTGWTGTLSFTPDRQILGVTGVGGLKLCRPQSGNCITLTLNSNIVAPQHAIQTSGGNYYVTQGWTIGQPHRVNEVDRTGQALLYQFGDNNPGNQTGQLNWPRYLAQGPKGKVLVADYFNRRVVQFDPNLLTASDLVNSANTQDFGWPSRLLQVRGKSDEACCGSKLYIVMDESPLW